MNAVVQTGSDCAQWIRVRGVVQGVGFRPTVWRLARELQLRGWVANDGDGVSIYACGTALAIDTFVTELPRVIPPLARIDQIERAEADLQDGMAEEFSIRESLDSPVRTGVVADAAICESCLAEIRDPLSRRYRYPFTNCTHCGPRLTIVKGIPYDRSRTTMASFAMCAECLAEYHDPADRRFHAQPIACHVCGPKARLERMDGRAMAVEVYTMLDAVDAACTLLQKGAIVAIKGLGGYQLACDATNEDAVQRLRSAKRRERKPFALMARDLGVIRQFCTIDAVSLEVLTGSAAPIVILPAHGKGRVAPAVAPGVSTLGFMLPATGLHHLLLHRMDRPIVLTSGNVSEEPQCIDDAEVRTRLAGIAEFLLTHDRAISQRVDDSVVRVSAGEPRLLRRGRGYAPQSIPLPDGFNPRASVLAYGGELKNTFCLVRDGRATLSHHIGDLGDAATLADYRGALARYKTLFAHEPRVLVADLHPEYRSSKIARGHASRFGAELIETQHHHAHIAACLAENQVPLDHPPVIGVAFDGLGYGDDGTFWGGEFLLACYHSFKRVGTFKPVALAGGVQAIREPWRNTYAHLMAEMGWARFATNYRDLDLFRFLDAQDRTMLDAIMARNINSPLASSCGRLFDAVAAAIGICREHAHYEGQGAVELEACVDERLLADSDETLDYPFAIPRLRESHLPYIEPLAMWQALLGDLVLDTPVSVMATRFHRGLASVIVNMVAKIREHESAGAAASTVALSGGVFQNRVLLELVTARLTNLGFDVLTHRAVPANDGGLALGQAVIAAARHC
jgi:hydrogenase maturation protein HypF